MGDVTERERLEREIYQLSQIIEADAAALKSRILSEADRSALEAQIEARSARRAGLQARLDLLQD